MNPSVFSDVLKQFVQSLGIDLHSNEVCECIEVRLENFGRLRIDMCEEGAMANLGRIYDITSAECLTKLLQACRYNHVGHSQVHAGIGPNSELQYIVRIPERNVTLQSLFDMFDLLCGLHDALDTEISW